MEGTTDSSSIVVLAGTNYPWNIASPVLSRFIASPVPLPDLTQQQFGVLYHSNLPMRNREVDDDYISDLAARSIGLAPPPQTDSRRSLYAGRKTILIRRKWRVLMRS